MLISWSQALKDGTIIILFGCRTRIHKIVQLLWSRADESILFSCSIYFNLSQEILDILQVQSVWPTWFLPQRPHSNKILYTAITTYFLKHTINKDSTLIAKHTLNEDFVGFLLQFWLWSEIFLKWWDFKNGLWSLFLENDWLWHPKCYTCPGHSCLLTVFYFSGLTGPLRASTPHVMAHAVCIQVQYRI